MNLTKRSVILALDATQSDCSVALEYKGQGYCKSVAASRQHANVILQLVDEILSEANCALSELDIIAYAQGPGRFTGLRIACSVAQGLGYGLNIPLCPVSSLQTLAQGVFREEITDQVTILFDARLDEVYVGYYSIKGKNSCENFDDVLLPINDFLGLDNTSNVFAGCGALKYKNEILQQIPGVQILEGYLSPNAMDVITIVKCRTDDHDLIHAKDALPVYLRNKVTS